MCSVHSNTHNQSDLAEPTHNYKILILLDHPHCHPQNMTTTIRLLAQSAPITGLVLLENGLIVAAEGCALVIVNPDHSQERRSKDHKTKGRFQLFGNHVSIAGISFFLDYSSPEISRGVAWANNSIALVSVHRPSASVVMPTVTTTLNFIPIAGRWLNDGCTLALISLLNGLILYKVKEDKLLEEGRWETETETLYCACMAGDSLAKLVVFAGTSLKGIIVWRPVEGSKLGLVIHRLKGHAGIPFSLNFNEQWNLLLSSSDDRTVKVWCFSTREDESEDWTDKLVETAHNMAGLPSNTKKEELTGKANHWLPHLVKVKTTLTGHEARVWNAVWVNYEGFFFMISVGEDSTVHVDSLDGTVTKSWRAHDGASIYGCVYDQLNDLLYTAAHDGAVYKWKSFARQNKPSHILYDKVNVHPWTAHLIKINEHGRAVANKDYPRNVCVYSSQFLLALMDSGRLIVYHYYDKAQRPLICDRKFKRYGVLSMSCYGAFLAMGGLNGEFVLIRTQVREEKGHIRHVTPQHFSAVKVLAMQFPCKIINIHWMGCDDLCLIVTLTKAYLYSFDESKKVALARTVVTPTPKTEANKDLILGPGNDLEVLKMDPHCHRMYDIRHLERPGITSALIPLPDFTWLMVGDEVGSISLYVLLENEDEEKEEPVQETESEENKATKLLGAPCVHQVKRVHKEGVTSLVQYKGWILSGGRYGGIKRFIIDEEDKQNPRLIQVQEFFPPFQWVARLIPILEGTELLVGGFHKGCFIIYSWEHKRILEEIPNVGGGHRRWDWKCTSQGQSALGFLRDKELYFYPSAVKDCLDVVLKPGLHSKTINCGIILKTVNHKDGEGLSHYLATGSEDGSIRILDYSTIEHNFASVHRITSHASSIRALVSTQLDEDRILLWSGGGRSELHASLLVLNSFSESRSAGHIVLVGSWKKKRIATDESDTRVMDLALLPQQTPTSNSFLIGAACSDGFIRIVAYSLTLERFEVMNILSGNDHALLTVHLWSHGKDSVMVVGGSSNGDFMLWKLPNEILNDPPLTKILPSFKSQVRLCAVMSMAVRVGNDIEVILGGDDCSVSLWKLDIDPPRMWLIWSHDQEQRGAVTGVGWGRNTIFSCSNDQVIARWEMEGGKVLVSGMGGVRDCQGFILSPDEDVITCFGDGISFMKFDCKS